MVFSAAEDSCPIPGFYASFAPTGPEAPPLDGSRRASVAIVGAGFTGLSAALHLAERGIAPLVLAAKEIGWGASGRNLGPGGAHFKPDPDHLPRRFRPEIGAR